MSGILVFVIIMSGKCLEFSFLRSESRMTSVLTKIVVGGKQTPWTNFLQYFYMKSFKTVFSMCSGFPPNVMLLWLDQFLSNLFFS